MLISRSFLRKVVATLGAAVGLVFVYETTIRDSRHALAETAVTPKPGARLRFTATAYCKGDTTASGVSVRTGIAAADPALLPVGTVVRLDTADEKLNGIWTIMDTGPAVQGRTIDLYLWSCHEALRFGRQPVQVDVLRLGWHPQNSEPTKVSGLFKKRESDKAKMLQAQPRDPPPASAPASEQPATAGPVPPPTSQFG